MNVKKHPGFILAVDYSFFQKHPDFGYGVTYYPTASFINEVASSLVLREREHLDNSVNPEGHKGDQKYRQLLPYVIIRRTDENGVVRYLPYRRTSGVGESRLAGNVSIGFGGHIDLNDIVTNADSSIDLVEVIRQATTRELDEEVRFLSEIDELEIPATNIKQCFGDLFILDNANDVGKLHVGLIMTVDLDMYANATTKEDELASMDWKTAEELLNSELQLENWTWLYLGQQHPSLVTSKNPD